MNYTLVFLKTLCGRDRTVYSQAFCLFCPPFNVEALCVVDRWSKCATDEQDDFATSTKSPEKAMHDTREEQTGLQEHDSCNVFCQRWKHLWVFWLSLSVVSLASAAELFYYTGPTCWTRINCCQAKVQDCVDCTQNFNVVSVFFLFFFWQKSLAECWVYW